MGTTVRGRPAGPLASRGRQVTSLRCWVLPYPRGDGASPTHAAHVVISVGDNSHGADPLLLPIPIKSCLGILPGRTDFPRTGLVRYTGFGIPLMNLMRTGRPRVY